MTATPPADPSPRALGASLAALAAQLADLRGEIRVINARLDQAGLRADLDLAARFEDLAQTVAGTLEAAAPRGPAASGPVPVDGEQHGAEHHAVVRVELAADRGDQLAARPGRVLVPPGSDGGAGPGQVRRVVVSEPHSRSQALLLNPAVRSMADASSPSRANVVTGSVPRGEPAGKGS